MEIYLAQFITVAVLHILVLVSPGPDFVLVAHNSLKYSRRSGLMTAMGVGLGILVHAAYSIAGLAYLISQSVVVFNIVKILGGIYLVYIGFKALTAKNFETSSEVLPEEKKTNNNFSDFRTGFLTNILNPKVTLFFLALFTQVISADTPLVLKLAYAVEMSAVTTLWVCLVAYAFSHDSFRTRIIKVQKYIDKTLGLILVVLGLKIIVTR
jgi:RhtB (resistance to homoserine/threonine) family protein